MEELNNALMKGAKDFGLEITPLQTEQFERFASLLLDWNEKMNLTAIISPAEIAYKHFIDSVLLLKYVDIPTNSKIIDVGCGAGFPSLPLLIMRPDLDFTMLDGTEKRLKFIDCVLSELGLSGKTLHLRAEEAGKNPKYREKFDFAVSRAVARLNTLSEYCIPLIKNGGSFVALKAQANDETNEARNAIKLLGAKVDSVKEYDFYDYGERNLVIIKKISQTPPKYPRASAQISKKPL